MSDFEPAIATVLAHEGGYVDDPDDLGGATNWGVSTLILRQEAIEPTELGLADFSPASIRAMTVDAAKALYRRVFWDRHQYWRIVEQTVATKVFDCGVNMGPRRAHVLAQQAAVMLGAELEIDGRLGPVTFAAINACHRLEFLQTFGEQMADYYRARVEQKPSQKKFLRTWLLRAAWPGLVLSNTRRLDVPDPHATPKG